MFSRSGPDGRETTIDISTVEIPNTAGVRPETPWMVDKTVRVWIAKKRVVKDGAAPTLQWADSRTCYPITETLAMLIDLEQPTGAPVLKRVDQPKSGPVYRIEAAGLAPGKERPNAVRLESGAEVSPGVVVEQAFSAWRSCWSDAAPTFIAKSDF